ncbi:hypothetical protein MUJ63_10560 [Lachnospiraceae bacterium NSJ-143]|nr:hypothetical protein [Lachnospiraceae bacterium NSJ-143]
MAEYTANYRLKKPDRTDYYNVADFNSNSDIIDKYVKQNFDESKSYTDSKKAEAVAETKDWAINTFSNPNLLRNGDSQVWQRGTDIEISGATRKYTADGWGVICFPGARVKKGTKGFMEAIIGSTVGDFSMQQIIEINSNLWGKKLTLSYDCGPEYIYARLTYSLDGKNYSDLIGYKKSIPNTRNYITTNPIPENSTMVAVYIYKSTNHDMAANMVIPLGNFKLELGETATPFVPRPYGEELALCQRYFYRIAVHGSETLHIGQGYAKSQTEAFVDVTLPTIMRIPPTVTVSDPTLAYLYDTAARKPIKSIVKDSSGEMLQTLKVTMESNVLTTGNGVMFNSYTTGFFIDFDAEIY